MKRCYRPKCMLHNRRLFVAFDCVAHLCAYWPEPISYSDIKAEVQWPIKFISLDPIIFF